MTFIEFEPMVEFEKINNKINNIFNNISIPGTGKGYSLNPKIDISEDEKNIYIEAEIPGIKKEEIKVKLEDKKLTISGEKKDIQPEEINKKYHVRERIFGTFNKEFILKADIDRDSINAGFENGLLTVTIGKIVPQKTEREIKIR